MSMVAAISEATEYWPPLVDRSVRGAASARLLVDDREMLNFAGHGYLVLAGFPAVRRAAREALDAYGFAAQIPPAYGGKEQPFTDAEAEAAQFFGTQDAVYLPSGYMAGMAALAGEEPAPDRIYLDASAHFSLIDAARISGKPVHVFAHADPDALRRCMAATLSHGEHPAVLTDGCFATTGFVPPLAAYQAELSGYGGVLLVDEAHSAGAFGRQGRGSVDWCGIGGMAGVRSFAMLSKAFCAGGAVVPASFAAAERIRSRPPMRGAAQGSPAIAAAAAAALRLARAHPEFRDTLAARAERLRSGLVALGIAAAPTPAPIVAFQAGRAATMRALQHRLFAEGIHLTLSNYIGAGPEGMMRCAIFRDHSEADIDRLIDALGRLL